MIKRIVMGFGVLGMVCGTRILAAGASTEFPSVDSAALGTNPTPPWSEPVQINDPFEGSSIGVFDRNFFFGRIANKRSRIEIQSLWRQDEIRFLLTLRDRTCANRSFHYGVTAGLGCTASNDARDLQTLFLKVEETVYEVAGDNSTFPVTPALAQVLRTAPTGKVNIRLVSESGEIIDSEIGEATVAAWQTVYDASQASNLVSE